MDLEYIKEITRKERGRDLRPLPLDFYDNVLEYTISLEEEMKKNGRPRSIEYKMLEDELTSAISDVETIFMRRTGKIIERATSNAFSSSGTGLLKKDEEKLHPEEKVLYETVLNAINEMRSALIEKIVEGDLYLYNDTNEKSKKEETEKNKTRNKITKNNIEENKIEENNITKNNIAENNITKNSITENNITKNNIAKNNAKKSENGLENEKNIVKRNKTVIKDEYILVRILMDLPEFMGDDKRNYRIRSQDVVLLPAANANLLIKRNIALPILR